MKDQNLKTTSVLMVGMSLTKTRGGISTLIDGILKSSLADEFDFDYVESQAEDYRGAAKALLAARALAAFAFKALVRQRDLAYVHMGSNASLFRESLFILLARFFGLRVVTHFHAGDVDEYLGSKPSFGRRFVSFALDRSDLLIAVSDDSARKLKSLAPNAPMTTIPNAVDAAPFAAMKREATGDAAVRLLFVGAMGKLKGERDLVDALAALMPRFPNLRVAFLGFGADSLAEYCREKSILPLVEFVGPVAPDARFAHFAKADIFVLPTYAEAMPMAVIEAMSAGLPVVSTTVGGIPELIDDGCEGFLCEPGDTAALADAIARYAADARIRHEAGARGREKAGKLADFDVYTTRLKAAMLAVNGAERNAELSPKELTQH